MKFQAFFLSAIALLLAACQSNSSDTAAQSAGSAFNYSPTKGEVQRPLFDALHFYSKKNNLKKFSVFPKPQFNFCGFFVRKKV